MNICHGRPGRPRETWCNSPKSGRRLGATGPATLSDKVGAVLDPNDRSIRPGRGGPPHRGLQHRFGQVPPVASPITSPTAPKMAIATPIRMPIVSETFSQGTNSAIPSGVTCSRRDFKTAAAGLFRYRSLRRANTNRVVITAPKAVPAKSFTIEFIASPTGPRETPGCRQPARDGGHGDAIGIVGQGVGDRGAG